MHTDRQCNHGQFSVVPGVSGCQVEVWEVDDVVVLFSLLVEEPCFSWPADHIVGDDPLDQNGLDSVQ